MLQANLNLHGQHVTLMPLSTQHIDDLFHAAQDESIWHYLPCPMPTTRETMSHLIQQALHDAKDQRTFPFAIIDKPTQKAIGSTRYWDIDPHHRRLEIGWTWLGKDYQRSPVNTECKFLLLGYGFETLNLQRIQLKTDKRNLRSQKAIERLGATKEGILRKHVCCWDGHIRDSVFYSILDNEWPSVKKRLLSFLNQAKMPV